MTQFIVNLESQENGKEEFLYSSLDEAEKGFRRLKRNCSHQYKDDGIYRTLTLAQVYDSWNTNDIDVADPELEAALEGDDR